jgi:hypothetical protein
LSNKGEKYQVIYIHRSLVVHFSTVGQQSKQDLGPRINIRAGDLNWATKRGTFWPFESQNHDSGKQINITGRLDPFILKELEFTQ